MRRAAFGQFAITQNRNRTMIAFIVIVLLLIIAYAVAPTIMTALFNFIWILIKIAFVLAIIGGVIFYLINL